MSNFGKFRSVDGMFRYMGDSKLFTKGCMYHVRFTYNPIKDVYGAYLPFRNDLIKPYDSIAHFFEEWIPAYTPKNKFLTFIFARAFRFETVYVSELYLKRFAS